MKKINWSILIVSLIISLSFNLKAVINKGVDYFAKKFHLDLVFTLKVTVLCIIIYFVLYFLFKQIDKIKLKNKKMDINKKNKILIFIAIFIPGLGYLLVHYPAVYLNDTNFILYNPIVTAYGHPLFYGVIMSFTFFTLKVYLSSSVSVFIMSFIQTIISSIIITELIVWFNKKINNKYLTIILFLYYFLTPIVTNYNVTLNKDTPYSLMLVILFVLIYEFVETKGKAILEKKYFIKLAIVSVLVVYLRTNGIYLIIPTLIVLFIVYDLKKNKMRYASMIAIVLVFYFIQIITVKTIGVTYAKKEMYAVPIQQVCYLVKYHPDAFTKDDYKMLSKILPNTKKTVNSNYNPYTVDDIKGNKPFNDEEFNNNEKAFVAMWAKKIPNNFSSYIKSYLLNSYHLWAIDKLDKSQSIFEVASIHVADKEHIIYNKRILPKPIHKIMNKYYKIFNTYLNPGGCFILLLITISYALYRKRKEVVLLSLPLLFTWLVLMIASPLSSALRYMAVYIYLLPVIMLYTFKITRKDVKNGVSKKSKK